MNILQPIKRIDLQKPVMQFYEELEWLRVEVPGQPTRYVPKKFAADLLWQIKQHSFQEKSELSI